MKNNFNIPEFRGLKLETDEYVIGHYLSNKDNTKHWIRFDGYMELIDPTTLSIHFPDMLDSENKKIFASLREDGKGGDTLISLEYMFNLINKTLIFRKTGGLNIKIGGLEGYEFDRLKITGIQKC